MKTILAGFVLLVFTGSFAQTLNQITVNGSAAGPQLQPLWGDHYDLSINHSVLSSVSPFSADPNFLPMMNALQVRYWRCSIGRWEVGYQSPPNGTSTDTNLLKQCPREFYTGNDNMTDAANPANYHFQYLDTVLAKTIAAGALPYLCFDYMPFTLASQKTPGNPEDYSSNSTYTYFNGIRTSPPATPSVYAAVVRNVILHTRGLFAGTTNFGITYYEIGNEPDIPPGFPHFWTGNVLDFYTMYDAIADTVSASPVSSSIKLGAGSFAFLDTAFAKTFLMLVNNGNTRLDFVSYHSYSDNFVFHYVKGLQISAYRNAFTPNAELINAEWGRALDGADPAYDNMDHAILRAQVLMLMEVLGEKIATEALLADPGPGPDQLGLLYSHPLAPKPVTDAYLGFTKMNDCLTSLGTTTTAGNYAMAGKNSTSTKITAVVVAVDSLSTADTFIFRANSIPWNGGYFYRYEISDSTNQHALGVWLHHSATYTGNSVSDTIILQPGDKKIIVWQISQQPLTGIEENTTGTPAIFPNPSGGEFTLQNFAGKSVLKIFDITGREVFTKEITTPNETVKTNLPPGVYFYQTGELTGRIVIAE